MGWTPSFSVTKKEKPISSDKLNNQTLEIFTYLDILRRNFANDSFPDNPSIGQISVKTNVTPNEVYVYKQNADGSCTWQKMLSASDAVATTIEYNPTVTSIPANTVQGAIDHMITSGMLKYRGEWLPKQYVKYDVVTFLGSAWILSVDSVDNTGSSGQLSSDVSNSGVVPPPGVGWVLLARRGEDAISYGGIDGGAVDTLFLTTADGGTP